MPFFLINTLLLYIPLLALTDRQNYGQRNKLILVGVGNLRFLQVNSISLGGGEEYFHVGTKSLQFGDADGDARPKKNLQVAYTQVYMQRI